MPTDGTPITPDIPRRRVGPWNVGAVAMGGAGWAFGDRSEAVSVATIHAALDAGVTLVDTARAYTTTSHPSSNEALVAKALADHPRGNDVVVATKGGHYRAGESEFPVDGRPDTLRAHVRDSLHHLRRDTIALYFLHWVDPAVPLEESVGALADLRDAGLIEHVGVSNVDLAQLRRAQVVTPITAVQNPLSLFRPQDADLARLLSDEGIAYLAYQPLGGPERAGTIAENFPGTSVVAAPYGVSAAQVALAWVLHVAPGVIPVVGAGRPETVVSATAAASIALTPADIAVLETPPDRS
jgi:aryl-alcohol dehydrogenase-like predicted oxidoreductase